MFDLKTMTEKFQQVYNSGELHQNQTNEDAYKIIGQLAKLKHCGEYRTDETHPKFSFEPRGFYVLSRSIKLAQRLENNNSKSDVTTPVPFKLFVFNHYRCEERVSFLNMCTSFTIPSCDLDNPILLDDKFPNDYLSVSEKKILFMLCSDVNIEEENRKRESAILNKRILVRNVFQMNGFLLRVRARHDGNGKVLELSSVPREKRLTIEDFVELCRRILDYPDVKEHIKHGHDIRLVSIPLEHWQAYRPPKVLHLFLKECHRMGQSVSTSISQVETYQAITNLGHDENIICPHNNRIFEVIDIPVVPPVTSELHK